MRLLQGGAARASGRAYQRSRRKRSLTAAKRRCSHQIVPVRGAQLDQHTQMFFEGASPIDEPAQ